MPDEASAPVPIAADVDQPDKILAGLTARQTAIAAAAALVIWAGYEAARHLLPLPAYAALAAPLALAATALILGERDGLSLDRLLPAAWRQARAPRRLVTAPEGVPTPPAWRPAHSLRSRRSWRRYGATSAPTGSSAWAVTAPRPWPPCRP